MCISWNLTPEIQFNGAAGSLTKFFLLTFTLVEESKIRVNCEKETLRVGIEKTSNPITGLIFPGTYARTGRFEPAALSNLQGRGPFLSP